MKNTIDEFADKILDFWEQHTAAILAVVFVLGQINETLYWIYR
jgi:hypothetical protein